MFSNPRARRPMWPPLVGKLMNRACNQETQLVVFTAALQSRGETPGEGGRRVMQAENMETARRSIKHQGRTCSPWWYREWAERCLNSQTTGLQLESNKQLNDDEELHWIFFAVKCADDKKRWTKSFSVLSPACIFCRRLFWHNTWTRERHTHILLSYC